MLGSLPRTLAVSGNGLLAVGTVSGEIHVNAYLTFTMDMVTDALALHSRLISDDELDTYYGIVTSTTSSSKLVQCPSSP